jgi:hypothetical protein
MLDSKQKRSGETADLRGGLEAADPATWMVHKVAHIKIIWIVFAQAAGQSRRFLLAGCSDSQLYCCNRYCEGRAKWQAVL